MYRGFHLIVALVSFIARANAEQHLVRRLRSEMSPESPLQPKAVESEDLESVTNNSMGVQSWFKEHGVSDAVAALQIPDSAIGDGTVSNMQWPYFKHPCMQRRQEAVAEEMLKRQCKHVVEVGGYVSPVDGFLRDAARRCRQNVGMEPGSSCTLPLSYVNIDPSVVAPQDVTIGGMRSIHIPMTLADFTENTSLPFRSQFGLKELLSTADGLCACSLSLWDPHVKQKHDLLAYNDLFKNANFVAISSAADEMEHLREVQRLAKAQHLAQIMQMHRFDCSTELIKETSHYDGDELEFLDEFSRPDPAHLAHMLMLSKSK